MTDIDAQNSAPSISPSAAPATKAKSGGFSAHLKSVFIGGLIALVPFLITIWIINIFFGIAESISGQAASLLVSFKFIQDFTHLNNHIAQTYVAPVLAVIMTVVFVYLVGVLTTLVLGRKLLDAVDHFVEHLPLLKGIYGTTKQVISVFRQGGGGAGFQRVVLVAFPGPGMWTIAFVTNEITDSSCAHRYVSVFIPMTPNPTCGFFQLIPEEQVRNTDWTVDQAIKIVLSGGLLAPSHLNFGEKTTADQAAPDGAGRGI
ncbi:MAG TPA: DUF502 domain-containing protein [Phycisphaerae bacterium]|nr:DUF502 domain-containing protein [Phycisphaerae bacterium]